MRRYVTGSTRHDRRRSRCDRAQGRRHRSAFHTLDPFPFRDRDLDREAEEYIVGWARELPLTQSIKIVIHFPRTESQMHAAPMDDAQQGLVTAAA